MLQLSIADSRIHDNDIGQWGCHLCEKTQGHRGLALTGLMWWLIILWKFQMSASKEETPTGIFAGFDQSTKSWFSDWELMRKEYLTNFSMGESRSRKPHWVFQLFQESIIDYFSSYLSQAWSMIFLKNSSALLRSSSALSQIRHSLSKKSPIIVQMLIQRALNLDHGKMQIDSVVFCDWLFCTLFPSKNIESVQTSI